MSKLARDGARGTRDTKARAMTMSDVKSEE